MSDQVIFTKEEVARLRVIIDGYWHVCKECDMPAWGEDATEGLHILDSSRPRPKVDIELLRDIQFGEWSDSEIVSYFSKYDIDVDVED